MIDRLTDDEKQIIWRALVHAIESNSGIGFTCNNDQGHPAYLTGAEGEVMPDVADTPERSTLFNLLVSFGPEFHQNPENPDLSTWQKYCSFAVESYRRATAPSPPQR